MAQTLTPEVISAAIDGLTAKQEAIGRQIAELRTMLPGASSDGNASETSPALSRNKRGGKRVLSPEARKRIAAAQRARWAKARGESQPAQTVAAAARKPKRKLSAAARARLVANLKKARAAKAAKAKAAGRKTAPAKKTARRKASAKKTIPAAATANA
jgi:hypothetical protein